MTIARRFARVKKHYHSRVENDHSYTESLHGHVSGLWQNG